MKKLAVVVVFVLWGAAPASAQELHQFLGPSSASLDGGQGYFSYHQACEATFKDSVWCTSKMIIEGGPAPGVTLAPNARYWVNPVPVGGLYDPTFGERAVTDTFHFENVAASNVLTCRRWQDGTTGASGLVIEGTTVVGVNGTFVNRACNNVIPAACCEVIKPITKLK